jgi:predicted RNA-binding Zn-ribbon protein involved in translation (DUF1610 family)
VTGRKSKPPRSVEDTDSVNIRQECPECGHEFFKTQRWLKTNHVFGCPNACGFTFVYNDDGLAHLFEEHVRHIRDLASRGMVSITRG